MDVSIGSQPTSVADFARLSIADFEHIARRNMAPASYEFFFARPGHPVWLSNRNNLRGFDNWELRPRVMRDTSEVRLGVELLGQRATMPIFIAPTGAQIRSHPDGELATARASGESGSIMAVSHNSSFTIEEIGAAGSGPLWLQIYPMKDPRLDENFISRAQAAGYSAIMVTVDNLGQSTRERGGLDLAPDAENLGLANYRDTDFALDSLQDFKQGQNNAITWDYLAWAKSVTDLPIIVKGIQTGEDAALCLESGGDAVAVSNHGGHALGNARATIDALPEVVRAVDGRIPVLLDGGVRSGSDVLKALGLGATAVMIGRPVFWGLAAAGQAGVEGVLEVLRSDLEQTMAFCGQSDVTSLTPNIVQRKFEPTSSYGNIFSGEDASPGSRSPFGLESSESGEPHQV
jgi:4-hydroxymandelate oxidase